MKILLVVNNVNQIGGIERVINRLANTFVNKLNYEVEILSLNTLSKNTFFQFDEKIKITHGKIPILKNYSIKDKIRNRKKFVDNVYDLLKTKEYDVLLTFHSYISEAVLLKRKKIKGKIIVTEHINYNQNTKLRKIVNNIIYNKSDKLVVLTQFDKTKYDKFVKNVCAIPNPVSFNSNEISNHGKNRIIAVGRLEYEKGFDYIIDAFNLISYKYDNWTLDIIGDGSQRKSLEKKIIEYQLENRVRVLPFTNDVKSEMLGSSIYAMTSRFEGFALVLTEAMECGLPCVSFDLPSTKEIIKDGEDGLLVEHGNIVDFAKKLEVLINDKELRIKYGKNAKRNVKRYDINNIIKQWEDLLKELVI